MQTWSSDLAKTSDAYASPLVSTNLKVMPPTSIVINELDESREDGVRIDEKLRAAGVKSALLEQKGVGQFGAQIMRLLNQRWPSYWIRLGHLASNDNLF